MEESLQDEQSQNSLNSEGVIGVRFSLHSTSRQSQLESSDEALVDSVFAY